MVSFDIEMRSVPGDNFSDYVKATKLLFRSENVEHQLNSIDTWSLTPGDLRDEEPELNQELKVEKDGILREQQEAEKLNFEIRKLESEYLNLLKEKRVAESRIEEKRNDKIPSKEDEETLRKIGKTLRQYKDITKIRWDYSASENVIKGYVYGQLKNYVHAFEIPLHDSEATDILWQEIEKASLKSSHNSEGKENVFHDNKSTSKKQ
ncbi:kinetochore protein Spc24-like [Hetaerina americana]|uniref:kinetochore protein Spc24-like n=1 Tax=Hetaerina americana TaxID=62018 RepID=UPI003A7F47D3